MCALVAWPLRISSSTDPIACDRRHESEREDLEDRFARRPSYLLGATRPRSSFRHGELGYWLTLL